MQACLDYLEQEIEVLDESAKQRLSEAVKALRGDKSQRAFADEISIGQSTIQHWESMGGGNPTLENIEKLAKARGEMPEDFLAYLYGRSITKRASVDEIVESLALSELLLLMEKASQKLRNNLLS